MNGNDLKTEERTWSYHGETLTVDDHGGWHIKGEKNDWPAYSYACAEIDKRQKYTAAIRKVPLDLPALTGTGEAVRITGIDRTNSHYITNPKSEGELYADTTQVLALIKRKVALESELSDTKGALFKVSIQYAKFYGRIETEDYADYAAKAVANHTKAVQAAKELEQP